eukprot:4036336-Prymnesium_polylepis.1
MFCVKGAQRVGLSAHVSRDVTSAHVSQWQPESSSPACVPPHNTQQAACDIQHATCTCSTAVPPA